jgi:hypothetical protein
MCWVQHIGTGEIIQGESLAGSSGGGKGTVYFDTVQKGIV